MTKISMGFYQSHGISRGPLGVSRGLSGSLGGLSGSLGDSRGLSVSKPTAMGPDFENVVSLLSPEKFGFSY